MVSWVPPGITRYLKRHFPFTEKMSDNTDYVAHIHLHRQTIPMPGGKQAQFSVDAVVGIGLSPAPFLGALIGQHSGPGGSA
jgi:hypothetical protein